MPGLVKQVEAILAKLDDTMTHANAAVVEIQKAVDNHARPGPEGGQVGPGGQQEQT